MTTASLSGRLISLKRDVADLEWRHLFELAAVLRDRKPAARVIVRRDQRASAQELLGELGLAVVPSRWGLAVERQSSIGDQFTVHVPTDDPRAESFALLVARDWGVARHAASAEEEGDSAEIGRTLGYPACCIAAYEQIEGGQDWLRQLLSSATPGRRPPALANKIAYLFDGASLLPDYFPCSLYCGEARRLASDHRYAAIDAGLAAAVEEVLTLLRRPIVVWRGLVIQASEGRLSEDERALAFGAAGVRCIDSGETNDSDRRLLTLAAGAVHTRAGIRLVDRAGDAMGSEADPVGALLGFEG